MAEAKSFADKAVELLLRSLRTVFNERVVLAVETLIVQTRESFIGQEELLESKAIFKSDRKINTSSTLPWMLSNEEKAKIDFSSVDFASQNSSGVGSAESEEVDIEAMINASKKALNFLRKQVRVQSTNLNSFAKTKKGELEQVRKERAIEKDRLHEEAALAKSLEEAAKKNVKIPVELVESIEEPEIIIPERPVEIAIEVPIEPEVIIPEKPVEIAIEVPIEPEVIQMPPSSKVRLANKPPKLPKPPKVKLPYSAGAKRKAVQLVVAVVIATVVFALLPQIKSGFSAGKDSISSTQEATPTPSTTQVETSSPTPIPSTAQVETSSPTPTPTDTPSASPTPTKTKAVNSGLLTNSARRAVVASLEKCALSTVYSPPGCPFEETAYRSGTSMYWTLSGVPKISLVSSKAKVLTLLVTGEAVAHVSYGEVRLIEKDRPFSSTAIATPSGATYIIKWK